MRHNLYANNSRGTPGKQRLRQKDFLSKPTQIKEKSTEDSILQLRISALMDRYKNNTEIIEEIKNKTTSYLLNISVAREIHSKTQEKKLNNEFSTYLSKLEKEN